jgi:hypothetical protein
VVQELWFMYLDLWVAEGLFPIEKCFREADSTIKIRQVSAPCLTPTTDGPLPAYVSFDGVTMFHRNNSSLRSTNSTMSRASGN